MKPITINPRVCFGKPTGTGTGLWTGAIFSRFRAGDSVAYIVADYENRYSTEEIEAAIRYECATKAGKARMCEVVECEPPDWERIMADVAPN